jgi:membrane-bound lytic murein transglycosylase F
LDLFKRYISHFRIAALIPHGIIGFKIFIAFLIFLLWSCSEKKDVQNNYFSSLDSLQFDSTSVEFDITEIKDRGNLKVILENTSTGYFLYKGRAMGFHYELIKDFCDKNDLNVEIIIENDFKTSFQKLLNGDADIIAHALTLTKGRKEIVNFMDPLYEVRQMLIQHKPVGWEKMKKHEIEEELIKSPSELIGKRIHVKKGSSYLKRLENLSDEIGGDIIIIEESGDVITEELIVMVADKTIEFTVADEDLADVGATYFDNIDVNMPISLPTQVGWAVRKNSVELLVELNKWISELKRKPDFNVLFKKYYDDPKGFKRRVQSDFSTITGNKISPYDDLIKKYAITINWDWRLLAAQIYQESQFNPKAKSWMGAQGLMQLVPNTAREFGANQSLDPEQNIKAGTNYIRWLEDYWGKYIDDPSELEKFVLASYNTGQGHVMDAMKLAEKYGKDPSVWDDNVGFYMLLKSNPKYYKDPVVNSGYCRGREPVNYVISIYKQFEIYKQFFN